MIDEPIEVGELNFTSNPIKNSIPKRESLDEDAPASLQFVGGKIMETSIEGYVPEECWVDSIDDLKSRYNNNETIQVNVFGNVKEFEITNLSYSLEGGRTSIRFQMTLKFQSKIALYVG